MVCCLFGHRDAPETVRPLLEQTLEKLIVHQQANTFLIGQQGAFDRMAASVIRQLCEKYPHVRCREVLAYFPRKKSAADISESIIPCGIECVPPIFAILWRNRWMVDHADIVVLYMKHPTGGTGAVAARAQRIGKQIINIAEM